MQKLFKNFLLFLQLIRYQNLLITTFTLIFSNYFLAEETNVLEVRFFALLISTVFVAAGGYICNDFYDIEIDLKNKPHKVLIGRVFSKKFVIFICFLLSFFALALGFYVSTQIGLIDLFSILSLWLYAFYLKKTPLIGNIFVAFLSALVILLLNVFYYRYIEGVVLLAIFAFFISLIREVIKDMEDIEGDRIGNCRTFPIVFGIQKSKYLVLAMIVLFLIFLESYNLIFKSLKINYLIIFMYQILIPLLSLFLAYRLHQAQSKNDFHALSSFCKVLMLIGLVGVMFF